MSPSMFVIDTLSKPLRQEDIINIRQSEQTEDLPQGAICSSWAHVFEWDENCVKASVLEQWRHRTDRQCDEALIETFPSLPSSVGVDLLEAVERRAAEGPGAARDFMDQVNRLPPAGVAATDDQIRRGQAFFYEYSSPILSGLMHFSLAGGFASARITRVLHAVSYLVPGKSNKSGEYSITQATNDRTYKRLLETLQMILDAMGGNAALTEREGKPPGVGIHALTPGEEGWKSVVRVRLLHGVARRRIMERVRRHEPTEGAPSYDFDVDGYPINQEDLAATLASFCTAPLWCMMRQGYNASTLEKEDFIVLWRHIGYYLGIDSDILSRHFSSLPASNKFLASVVVHLIEPPAGDKNDSSFTALPPPTMPILHAISNRQPFPSTLAYHCALTRFLVGDPLSNYLGVPETPLSDRCRLHVRLWLTKLPYLFGRIYSPKWEATRIRLSREGLSRVVRWQMGMRRTAFRPRREDGDIAKGVEEAEAVVPNMVLGQAFMREYNGMIREMLGVIGGTFVGLLLLGWKTKSWLL